MNLNIYNMQPLKGELRSEQNYLLAINTLGNKVTKACNYIICHISESYNEYFINRAYIARKLHCSEQTVAKAVNILKKDKYVIVNGHNIKLNYKEVE